MAKKDKEAFIGNSRPKLSKKSQEMYDNAGRSNNERTGSTEQPTMNNSLLGKGIRLGAGYLGRKVADRIIPAAKQRLERLGANIDNEVNKRIDGVIGWNPGKEEKPSPSTVEISAKPMGPSAETKARGGGGSGRGRSGSNDGNESDISLPRNSSSNLGYSVPNTVQTPLFIKTPIEHALYENPLKEQSAVIDNQPNYSRTTMRAINFNLLTGTGSDELWRYIFVAYYQEMLTNTNGGSQALSANMTQSNFKDYCSNNFKLYCSVMELMSLMAWNSTNPVQNKILRKIAGQLSSDTSLLQLRNKMLTALSPMMLPRPLILYGQWLTQTYKANNHSYSVEQRFTSTLIIEALIKQDFSAYKTYIEGLISTVSTNVSLNATLSALLERKTTGSWSTLSNVGYPCNRSTFDQYFNDIYNNIAIYTPAWDNSGYYVNPSTQTDFTTTVPGCFESGIGELPYHVIETFADRYSGYAPMCFTAGVLPSISGFTSFFGCSHVTLYENATTVGYTLVPVNNAKDQIGNHIVKIYRNETLTPTTSNSCDYQIAPRGNQTFYFDVALNMILVTRQRLVEMMFN